MTKRENWIDFCKGLSIMLIVFVHVDNSTSFLINWICSFFVPIFFITTGVLLSKNRKMENINIKKLVINDIKKILYPYATFSILASVYILISTTNIEMFVSSILRFISFDGYRALWFLPTLFISKIIFYLIYKKDRKFIILLAVFSILFYIITLIIPTDTLVFKLLKKIIIILNRGIIGATFIIVGYFFDIEKISTKKNINIISILTIFISLFLSQINGKVDLHNMVLNNIVIYYTLSIFISISILLISKNIFCKNNIIELFGKNSLIVLATHLSLPLIEISNKVYSCFELIFPKNIQYIYQNQYIHNFFCTLLVLFIEFFIIKVINKKLNFMIKFPFRNNSN